MKKVRTRKRGPGRPKDPIAREKLLEIATSLFAQKGYHAVSIREIASKANVNPASISYHFDCKLGLYAEIVEEQSKLRGEIIDGIHESMLEASAKECLLDRVDRLSKLNTTDMDFKRLVFRILMDDDDLELKEALRKDYLPAIWDSCEKVIGSCEISEKYPFLDNRRLSLLTIAVHNFWRLFADDFKGTGKLFNKDEDLNEEAHLMLIDLFKAVMK